MSGEMLVTGPAEPGAKQDTRPYDLTPYSHAWWAGSPYTSFKDFMENMNQNDAGRYRTSACTAMVDAGGGYPPYECGQHDYRSEMAYGPWANVLGWRCSGCARLGAYVTLKRAGIDVTANSFMAQQRLNYDSAPYAD